MSLDVWIVGPELQRALVVLYRSGATTGSYHSLRLPAPCGATDGFL